MAGGDDSDEPTPDFPDGPGAPERADNALGPTGSGPTGSVAPDRDAATVGRVRAGTLLIASTDLVEPTFARTVIYMIEHNEGGSLGVVLNRMSQTAVHNLMPAWTDLAASPRALFIGGPVKQDAALCLGVVKLGADISGHEGLRPVDGRVVLVDLDADPASLTGVLEGIRVFAGYSGWGIGQLDGELDQQSWMLGSALAKDLLAPPTADLWSQVLRRQPWPRPLLASHPIDVSGN